MLLTDAYEILLLLSILAHLFFSYLLVGGFPVTVITAWLGKGEGKARLKDLSQMMNGAGLSVMILAIFLGLLLGVVVYGKYGSQVFQKMEVFQLGYALLVIFLILTVGGIYAYTSRTGRTFQESRTPVMLVGGIVVCLLGTTFLFVIAHVMTLQPDHVEFVRQNGFLASISLPTVWPRFFHILLGSVAATGMIITLYGTLRPSQGLEQKNDPGSGATPFDVQITRYGVGWTLAGTLPQIVVGPWLLFELPDDVRMRLVDGASVSSLVFFVSLTLALLALVLLNASLMVPHVRGLVWTGLGSLFLTMVLMIVVREEVRKGWMQSFAGGHIFHALSTGVVFVVIITSLLGALLVGRIIKGRATGQGYSLGTL